MSKWLCLVLVFISSVSCSQKVYTGADKNIKIVSSAPVQPVLKRLSSNPLLRVGIYVPAGHAEARYRKIHGTLNADGVKAVEKLEGDIELSSSVGKGSTFKIVLPNSLAGMDSN